VASVGCDSVASGESSFFFATTSRKSFSSTMDPSYRNKKIVDLTDAELTALGFMGDNVAPGVKRIVDKVKASPDKLDSVTCWMVDCLRQEAGQVLRVHETTLLSRPTLLGESTEPL